MIGWLMVRLRAAMAAAATLTGKRFGLLVASSVVATSAIVAAAATSQPEASPIASILGHSLAADRTPVQAAPQAEEQEPEVEEELPEAVVHESTPEPEPAFVPEETIEPTFVPEETAPEIVPEETPPPEDEEPPEKEAVPPPTPEAGRIKHVFVVSVVSSGYDAAFGATPTMPYLSGTLRPKGRLLANYSVLSEPITPNGIALLSGQPPNKATEEECPTYNAFPATSKASPIGVLSGEGCVYGVETQTLAGQLELGQFTWKGYFEGMKSPTTGEPENCVYPGAEEEEVVEPGGYAAKLNPFTHFHSLLDVGTCGEDDVPITELEKDLKSEAKTANFSYISPDLCSAGVSGQCAEGAPEGAAAADEWLAEVVPEILESPAYKKDGLLIVTFGGVNPPAPVAEGETAPPAPPKPLKTGALLVSKFVTKNSTGNAPYNPFSLLRSTEELFGLKYLAEAAEPTVKTFAPELLGKGGSKGKNSGNGK
jgi:outer membrane biosynthesis protein TonB